MLNGLDLFSGIGGLTLALRPWVRPVAYCEREQYAQGVLLSRMADGSLPSAPIWDDVRTLGAEGLPGGIDLIYGGFPCQDLSDASHGAGGGLGGDQSGLWREMLRIVDECQPRSVFIENVDGAAWKRYVSIVRRDLWRLGYSSVPLRLRASDVGAPFGGSRIFILATRAAKADGDRESTSPLDAKVAVMPSPPGLGWRDWGAPETAALGVDDGIPCGMDRLRGLGNAVVPAQAREAFRRLSGLMP